MLFNGFVLKNLVDPELAKMEEKDFVAISHHKVSKLTQQQRNHVENKRLEKAELKSSEKSTPVKTKSQQSRLLSYHEDFPTEIHYPYSGNFMEASGCGLYGYGGPTIGVAVDKCFRCENVDTGEVRGCKVTLDYSSYMVNYTSYESLTCEDYFDWLDMETSTYPVNQCIFDVIRYDHYSWSTPYSTPYTVGASLTKAYYNHSYCDEAPIYYTKLSPTIMNNGEMCIEENGSSYGVTRGCEYRNSYDSKDCSGSVKEINPMKQDMGMCMKHDDPRVPFSGLFNQSHEIMVDALKSAFFCDNGQADRPNIVCMTENGKPCQDIFQKGMEGFVPVPSGNERICKPDKNDDELKVEFVHMARNFFRNHSMARVTITTPDDVSSSDRFRIVVKAYADKRKETMGSFKFNGRPENKTLTFQMEGPYELSFEPREVTVKIKQRVYNESRAFIRKSCVRSTFPHDDEEDGGNHHHSHDDPNHYPSHDSSHQPSYDPNHYPNHDSSYQPSYDPNHYPSYDSNDMN